MFITSLVATGFRNLDGEYLLCHPLSVVVGENNVGKSNVVDALRVVLEPEAGPRSGSYLSPDDFAHDGTGVLVAHELGLEVRLGDLTETEQMRMVTCLAPSLGEGCARIRLKAQLGADGRVLAQYVGGDAHSADVERFARDAVRFTYLHPLRDAAADLRQGRDNRLVALFNAMAPEGHGDRQLIVDVATQANEKLEAVGAVKDAKTQIADRLGRMTGGGRFAQKSDLAFADPRFDRVIGTIRALIGRLHPLEMTEGGLGFNNLLYMAVLLAALADATDDDSLRVLLVEEPEAHLHPQLQDLLMRFLESEAGDGTQVIVTSHSPSFASAARVERLTVMSQATDDARPVARRPSDFALSERHLRHLRRFLDVTKAALFFAKGVIAVEGIAEQLLIPVLAERAGRPLAANGIAVINVGGVAFAPFSELFGPNRLPYRLAVVTDDDAKQREDAEPGADRELAARISSLVAAAGPNVHVALAPRTFEWALAEAGNKDVMLDALGTIRPRTAARLRQELASATDVVAADAILVAVENHKGVFAQELADRLADQATPFVTPDYLRDAIAWVADVLP